MISVTSLWEGLMGKGPLPPPEPDEDTGDYRVTSPHLDERLLERVEKIAADRKASVQWVLLRMLRWGRDNATPPPGPKAKRRKVSLRLPEKELGAMDTQAEETGHSRNTLFEFFVRAALEALDREAEELDRQAGKGKKR